MSTSDIYARTIEEHHQHTDIECPECGGQIADTRTERVCEACGLVVATTPVDRGPEWRSFDDEEGPDRRRTGAPRTPARHDYGLGTVVGRHRDGQGNGLSSSRRRIFHRLRREHGKARRGSKRDKNLMYGLVDVRRLAGGLELPYAVRERACKRFRAAQQADLLRGRSIEAVSAACVYVACRGLGLSRTQAEIERLARCDRSALRNAIGVLNVEFGLQLEPPRPSAFVPRVTAAVDADLDPDVRRQALDLAARAEGADLIHGRHPFGVAAACVELADESGTVTQQELAAIAEVTASTVRAAREHLREHLEISEAP